MSAPPVPLPDPSLQFQAWYQEAQARERQFDIATLATSTRDGRPSARIVGIRGIGLDGIVFFTNYRSRKARELLGNPRAALVCYWPGLHRQVRIEGTVRKTGRKESETYFRTRPRKSQLSAWASDQSRVISSRTVLEKRVTQLEEEYEGREIPCPPFWGGFRLAPRAYEFWTGRPNRLHDRLRYVRSRKGWTLQRLAP